MPTPTTRRPSSEPASTESRVLTLEQVFAQWVQNFGGGVGAAIVVVVVMWTIGMPHIQQAQWALVVGATVFGASTLWRAYLDEIRSSRSVAQWRRQWLEIIASLDEDVAFLEAEHTALTQKYEALRAAHSRLESEHAFLNYTARKAQANRNTILVEDLVSRGLKEDTRTLVSYWAGTGKSPSRAEIMATGMSRSRWEAANQQLKNAGLFDGKYTEAEMLHKLDVKWATPVSGLLTVAEGDVDDE